MSGLRMLAVVVCAAILLSSLDARLGARTGGASPALPTDVVVPARPSQRASRGRQRLDAHVVALVLLMTAPGLAMFLRRARASARTSSA